MTPFFVIVGIAVLVTLFFIFGIGGYSRGNREGVLGHPIRQRYFFSVNEKRLYACLREIVGEISYADVALFSKVRWEDIWSAERGGERMRYRGFLRSRHIDFIILNVKKNRPAILIELNDKSHRRPDRQERDRRLREFCEDTGMPLLIIRARSRYDPAEIRRKIKECMEQGGVSEW